MDTQNENTDDELTEALVKFVDTQKDLLDKMYNQWPNKVFPEVEEDEHKKTSIDYMDFLKIDARNSPFFNHKARMFIQNKLSEAGFDTDKRYEQYYDVASDRLIFRQRD